MATAKEKLKVGQVVYIQGHFRAKITNIFENRISCDVYEGLPAYTKPPHNYTYQKGQIETKKYENKTRVRRKIRRV